MSKNHQTHIKKNPSELHWKGKSNAEIIYPTFIEAELLPVELETCWH